MKKEFPVIEVPADGRKEWYGGAYSHIFVYSPKGNVLLKGFHREVEEYRERHFPVCFYRHVMYHGKNRPSIFGAKFNKREICNFSSKCPLTIDRPKLKRKGYCPKYTVRPYGYDTTPDAIRLTFKRLPTKWIPEFDYLIQRYNQSHKI